MDVIKSPASWLKNYVNAVFQGKEPWQIVSITTSSVLLMVWIYDFLDRDESVVNRGKKTAFKLVKYIPQLRAKVDQVLDETKRNFEEDVTKRTSGVPYLEQLPDTPMSREEIFKTLSQNLALGEDAWKSGLASGAVYIHNTALQKLVADVFQISSYTNPLHPDLFPGGYPLVCAIYPNSLNPLRQVYARWRPK